MKKALFNIAWDLNEEDLVAKLLSIHQVTGVELALSKIWPNLEHVTKKQIKEYKDYWNKQGIEIAALCSLLYPHPEMNIFNGFDERAKMLSYLEKIASFGSQLGAKILVFGSPKNRNYAEINYEEAFKLAVDFFNQLAMIGEKYDVVFCIEPIPTEYKTNFINTTTEAVDLVKRINHPNFQLHLDSGAMTVNNEDYQKSIKLGLKYLKHFHISEDFLGEVGKGKVNHQKIAALLKEYNYDGWVSIEMPKKDTQKDNLEKIERVLKLVERIYK